ncbi:molybdate ABC transporter substrate-binding protein [Palleronia pelagia]|uniref:Molybdate transport system substrate-binding protein n=1 Tax=Palleronia pelagia TaxID=387096 RepID=A0A1H8AHQ9_9RHOB|nr:substrate-binding domain-containing protein [Palleronia pelagia]SEM70026.1 molybdate transport system substrate-binding protein [Palleronia pelagia]
MDMALRILSGGAANGLVNALRAPFRAETGLEIEGDFGAVGGMRDRIEGGERIDLAILTRAAIDALVAAGKLDGASVADLGGVDTGVAVRAGTDHPSIADGAALARLFSGADGLFCPDTQKATAGIHFAAVLKELGLADADTLKEYPNGQTAMAAMAKSDLTSPVGCTQVTEILNTEGVDYVGALPPPHDLSTTYTAAVAVNAMQPEAARALIAQLIDPARAELRRSVGFT